MPPLGRIQNLANYLPKASSTGRQLATILNGHGDPPVVAAGACPLTEKRLAY
jgi:hypothetical protein